MPGQSDHTDQGDDAEQTGGHRPTDSSATLPPWLREVLRCPACRSELVDGSGPAGAELHCTDDECRRAYRIEDGIPVLLIDESHRLER